MAAIAESPFLDPAPAGQVWARRAADVPLARVHFRERIGTSLWFVPTLFVIGAFVLSKITVVIDRSLGFGEAPRWLLGAHADTAGALTATVATAMLTFLGVVFSTTLIAIQLAGGQYSPRIVRVFIRSRLTHVTLGVFLATFVFALNGLVEVRGADTALPVVTISMVYLLLLATLAMFVMFLHGMAKMLRVQYLLNRVTKEGRVAMFDAFPPAATYELTPDPALHAARDDGRDGGRDGGAIVRNETTAGVLQAVDRASLVGMAAHHDVCIELLVEVGEYLSVATPIARVRGDRAHEVTGEDIAARFLLGGERTLLQDPGFAFRQLVDVAIRALSPSVNDPTTGVQSIDRLEDLLATVAARPDPTGWFLDDGGVARLHCREPGIARLANLAFVEVIRYGADSPQVVRRLRATFDVLEGIERPDVVTAIDVLRHLLDQTEAERMPAAFAGVSAEADRHGLG